MHAPVNMWKWNTHNSKHVKMKYTQQMLGSNPFGGSSDDEDEEEPDAGENEHANEAAENDEEIEEEEEDEDLLAENTRLAEDRTIDDFYESASTGPMKKLRKKRVVLEESVSYFISLPRFFLMYLIFD